MQNGGGSAGTLPPSVCLPVFEKRQGGTVLVCGFGPTLHDDLARAHILRPDAPVIAVNNAASAVKAFALFSQHYRKGKLDVWVRAQRKRFGDGFTVHSHAGLENIARLKEFFPWVDHWWAHVGSTGTSAWSAAKMARQMGFSEIILCGVPLERGAYADGSFCRDFRHNAVLKLYRNYIRKDVQYHEGVKAMSGWTRKFFGEPV